jgi:Recombination directionality factor-like
MPINGILDLQRRDAPLGEIRIGTSVEVPGKDYRKPVRLETFRFTTASEHNARQVAAHYGGQVAPWTQKKGYWEVTTDRKALDVWVPPRELAVDANMELWDGPKRLRKCDGITESMSGQPCMCPRATDPDDPASVQWARNERKRLAALKHPEACKPLTRINVTIPDLPGLTGVWRINTGSENTAVETAAAGDAMVMAREGGAYLPAIVYVHWRNRALDGAPYPVLALQIGLSLEELAKGQLPPGPMGLVAQLRGGTAGAQAIGAGRQEARAIEAPAAPDDASTSTGPTAQYFADLAPLMETREDVEELVADAKGAGVLGHMARIDREGTMGALHEYLQKTWRKLPSAPAVAS